MSREENLNRLNLLKKKMLFDKTLPLRKSATNLVFGEGNPETKIMFIGEGPGYWEDQRGRPFVGNAGGLLNQLLYSIKLQRENVFITNVVCYRPPANRDPLPEEIMAFQPYIDEMIEIIKPKIIVTLGRFSMTKFLPNAKITAIHGNPQSVEWKGRKIVIVPMYHPAAALRRGEIMLQIKNDFLKIPQFLEGVQNKVEVNQMKLI